MTTAPLEDMANDDDVPQELERRKTDNGVIVRKEVVQWRKTMGVEIGVREKFSRVVEEGRNVTTGDQD